MQDFCGTSRLAASPRDRIGATTNIRIVAKERIPAKSAGATTSSASGVDRDSGISEAEGSARKLVDKLAAGGQLRAGLLLRMLQQGEIMLFELAFARLVDLEPAEFRGRFYQRDPRPVALACRAVGIDRSVFSTVFNLSRQARGTVAQLSFEQHSDVAYAFKSFSRAEAMVQLHTQRAV